MQIADLDLTIPAHQRLPEQGPLYQLNAMELSHDERMFLLEHLEDSPAKALKGWDRAIPHRPEPEHGPKHSINPWREQNPGIIPEGMWVILARIREVEEVAPERLGYYQRDKSMAPLIGKPVEEYRGLEAIRECIKDSLEYERRLRKIRSVDQTAALNPSLYTRDARGRLHWQGPGSDRGVVRRFTCWISHQETGRTPPEWIAAAAADTVVETDSDKAEKVAGAGADYALIEGDNYFECPVTGCNYRRSFRGDDEEDRRKAKGAMRTHMANVKANVDDHREAKVVIFG